MTIVTLPRLHWGDVDAPRRALLVHGLGSSAATTWNLSESLAAAGWSATAVDLRGHGAAPRASRYRIEDYAADLVATTADDPWDLVMGHSIGGAAATVAAAQHSAWTQRLVLLDPALLLDDAARERVLANQRAGHASATVDQTAADHPRWHPIDVEQRVTAVRSASLHALEQSVLDNDPWDVTAQAALVLAPTLVIAADPEHGSMFAGEHAAAVLAANPLFESVVLPGAGHSVHRDRPAATLEHTLAWLEAH